MRDLHLWRLGPGHLGAIVSIGTRSERDEAYFRERLAGFEGLSHLTVEIVHARQELTAVRLERVEIRYARPTGTGGFGKRGPCSRAADITAKHPQTTVPRLIGQRPFVRRFHPADAKRRRS